MIFANKLNNNNGSSESSFVTIDPLPLLVERLINPELLLLLLLGVQRVFFFIRPVVVVGLIY